MDFTYDFTGVWMSADHSVRKVLLPNGRFIAVQGAGERRAEGDYRIVGSRIAYRKDNGMTGEGEFIAGVLHSAGLTLYLDGMVEQEAA